MPSNVLTWLKELDQLGWYAPENFDYFKEFEDVKKMQTTIEEILEVKLHLQAEQDSACLATLGISSPIYRDPVSGYNTQNTLICIRFCNFGRMVTLDGRELEKWNPMLPKLYVFLEAENYAVVGRHILDKTCDGSGPRGTGWGGLTWFGRFFDYL